VVEYFEYGADGFAELRALVLRVVELEEELDKGLFEPIPPAELLIACLGTHWKLELSDGYNFELEV